MKRWLFLHLLAASFFFGLAPKAEAQIPMPVLDFPAFTQKVEQHAETVLQWATEIAQLKLQYDMLESAYHAVVGVRGVRDILDNPILRQYLPQEWVKIYDDVNHLGYHAMNQATRNIYEANRVFDACASIELEDERLTCEALAIQAATKKGLLLPALQMTAQRALYINQLQERMSATEDMKEAAEIQALIATEQTNIANSQIEMEIFKQSSEIEKEILIQKKKEEIARTFAKRGYLIPDPITF